jgi:hypothetical protein
MCLLSYYLCKFWLIFTSQYADKNDENIVVSANFLLNWANSLTAPET